MPIELWLSFIIAASAVLAIPGPTMMLVAGYALDQGRSTGWATIPGLTLGDFTAMTASLLGVGAVLAASATLFTILKLFGAAYLIWMGIQLWRAGATHGSDPTQTPPSGRTKLFWNAYIVTTFNPKSILFFVAFVPQFVNPDAPALAQFVILEATFLVLAATNGAICVVLAGWVRAQFERPSTLGFVNRLGGGAMIGAGLLIAAAQRTS